MADQYALHTASGDAQIDQVTLGVVALLDLHFPQRIRSCYFTGSCADRALTPLSDIDFIVVFKDQLHDVEQRDFTALTTACKGISPRSLDISCMDEATVFHADQLQFSPNWRPVLGAVTLKSASTLAYGDDVRDSVPLVPHDVYTQTLMHFPYLVLHGQRGHPPQLPFPLTYPDPDDEFYGYTARRLRAADGTPVPSTKRLVHASGFIATALVTRHTPLYIADKRTAVTAYHTYINDAWTEHLTTIQQYCRVNWGYQVPQAPADRQLLRGVCERELAFENFFLAIYKAYLEQEQSRADEQARQFAQERLQQIA